MKFGILTFHNIPNYGAAFQALALCKAIRELGADCEIIDYKCKNILHRELQFKKSSNPLTSIVRYFLSWLPKKKRIERFNQFMSSQCLISSDCYDKCTIVKSNEKYDAFISGSDMIWDLGITAHDYSFFLDFTQECKKRFSYGSSLGNKWGKDTDSVISFLRRYDLLAVRESNVQNMIQKYGLQCNLVADPTMLIESDYWIYLSRQSKAINRKKRYVLVYFAYKEILAAAKKYADDQNLELVVIADYRKPFCGYKNLKIFEPQDWLKAFCDAEIVFTDSYHGVLFSMYFEKQFWTNNRCNKIESILNLLGLSDRFIDCGVTSKKFSYDLVNKKIEELRKKSLDYLSEIISISKEDFSDGAS